MRGTLAFIILINVFQCEERPQITCNNKFFKCAEDCGDICERSINFAHEFGKCFTICNTPCRKEYCKKISYDE
jgi:hypothetical protein